MLVNIPAPWSIWDIVTIYVSCLLLLYMLVYMFHNICFIIYSSYYIVTIYIYVSCLRQRLNQVSSGHLPRYKPVLGHSQVAPCRPVVRKTRAPKDAVMRACAGLMFGVPLRFLVYT